MTFRVALFFLLSFQLKATSQVLKTDFETCTSHIEFKAVGNPSALQITGVSEKLNGKVERKDQKIIGFAELDLSSLDTGLSLRDKHMKEKYLDVKTYPKAKIEVESMPWMETTTFQNASGEFHAHLTLHGVRKKIQGKASISKEIHRVSGTFDFTIDLYHFNIEIPQFMEITMAKTVDIHVELKCPT